MAPRQLASDTARSIRRRLEAVAYRERSRRWPPHPPAVNSRPTEPSDTEADTRPEVAAEERADDANLDALRGELVRELDRLAATDHGSSASFRRV